MSHHPLARRTGVLLAVTALATGALASVPTGPAAAETVPVTGASTAGATWLAGQLTDGLVVGDWGPDYGLSVDVGITLHEVGGRDAAAQAVTDAVEADLAEYITGEAFGDAGSTYAGSTGKAAVLALVAGRDLRDFGGEDLVARLERVTADSGPAPGRIADVSTWGDYANTIGQAYATRALHAGGSPEAEAATDFLLAQQCEAGYFRLLLADAGAADQTCDGDPGSVPDTDVTALAVLSLLPQADTAEVSTHVEAALAWLARNQAADGSFGGGSSTENHNANSTGLAGWALSAGCRIPEARRAASWVSRLQVGAADATGPLGGEQGAVAYDAAALVAARTDGITDGTRDQWRRASAQAVPSLAWAPGGRSPVRVTGPQKPRKAAATVRLTVSGAAAGQRVCLTGPAGLRRSLTGTGTPLQVRVTLPRGTGTAKYTASTAAGDRHTTVRFLGRKKLPVTVAKRRVRRGGTQVVQVRGLAAREQVRVHVRGKRVALGTASAKGRFSVRFKVRGPLAKRGKAPVTVRGQFGNRAGTTTFRVRP